LRRTGVGQAGGKRKLVYDRQEDRKVWCMTGRRIQKDWRRTGRRIEKTGVGQAGG
jgi:hypothetical protein